MILMISWKDQKKDYDVSNGQSIADRRWWEVLCSCVWEPVAMTTDWLLDLFFTAGIAHHFGLLKTFSTHSDPCGNLLVPGFGNSWGFIGICRDSFEIIYGSFRIWNNWITNWAMHLKSMVPLLMIGLELGLGLGHWRWIIVLQRKNSVDQLNGFSLPSDI